MPCQIPFAAHTAQPDPLKDLWARLLRIPTQGGQVFRLHGGHRTELMAATIPT
jgi:hypothetical protein